MLLRDKDRDRLCQIFDSVHIPFEVWAYGSRVNGTAHEGSDLDLAIRSEDLQKLPLEVLEDLKEQIRHTNIPIIVELFDWARLPASFQSNIEASYELLYSSDRSMAAEPKAPYGATDNR